MDSMFSISEHLQDDVFLSVVLEFVSLLEDRSSILSVVELVEGTDLIECDGHFAALLEIEGAVSELRDYGLQCMLPQTVERTQAIEGLIASKATASEVMASGCCRFANWPTMQLLLRYFVGQWIADRDPLWFEAMHSMVSDDELFDRDNNDKLLLLSSATSIFHDIGSLSSGGVGGALFAEFVRECIAADVLSLSVLDKWRMDEFDRVTVGKKDALMVLSDLIHSEQNKEIKMRLRDLEIRHSDQALWSQTTDEEDFADSVDGYRCIANYIGSHQGLLPINSNRTNMHHRCPWKVDI